MLATWIVSSSLSHWQLALAAKTAAVATAVYSNTCLQHNDKHFPQIIFRRMSSITVSEKVKYMYFLSLKGLHCGGTDL